MPYLQGLSEQVNLFLNALGFGFLLGLFYGLFRIFRLLLGLKKLLAALDVCYVLLCAFLMFFYLLALNGGQMAAFMLFGTFFGWLVYYFSLGVLVSRVSNIIIKSMKSIIQLIFMRPLGRLWRLFRRVFSTFRRKTQKKHKKFIKKSKYHLKKKRTMRYTSRGILLEQGQNAVKQNQKERRRRNRDAKQKSKKEKKT